MDTARRYYEEEMRYLHEAGKAFAEAHPDVARLLNADSLNDRDPYVERLFEGFAFLTGRIRERLDDEMPEYTEALCDLLYPHFLRPIPSLSIVELRPKAGVIQKTTVLERGIELRSEPVGDEYVVCRFATTQAVRLQPLQVTHAGLEWSQDGTSTATVRLELDRGVEYADLDLASLRFYLHADPSTASTMHLFLTRHVRRVVLRAGGVSVPLMGQGFVRPGGLGGGEGLLDYGPYAFSGFRLLQEYLAFRRKFWFVDVYGLDRFSPEGSSFEIDFVFDRPYPEDRRFSAENLRLHCTPVVNLFNMEAEPVRVDGFVSEYRIVPSVRYRKSSEAYDVEEVIGIEDNTGKRHPYTPFYRFSTGSAAGRRYVLRRRSGPSGLPELYVTLVDSPAAEGRPDVAKETLSIQLACTNGVVPREKLVEGMISQVAPEVPQIVSPKNLTQPTLIVRPPSQRHKDFFWKLISHWSLNFLSVATKEALTGLLELYDWAGDEANRKRIAGIRDVRWAPKEVMRRGSVLRGAEVTVVVQDGYFSDEGDLNLFGLVLSEFLSMYATINSFVHLVIEQSPTGRRLEWQPNHGAMPVV